MRSRISSTLQKLSAVALMLLTYAGTSPAEGFGSLQLESGEQQVALIELYTSEGCSSCPPADRWLSGLKSDDRLWREFVPIALHVDYWNYIGWTDRFSKSVYSNRQREYVRNGDARVAYTPGFFVNGDEWRGWFGGKPFTTTRPSVGSLGLGLDGNTIAVHFTPLLEIENELTVNIALLGMQLETDVHAGENSGRNLRHDFVVLNIQSFALQPSAGGYKAIDTLDEVRSETDTLAIAAWISAKDDQTPIQAVGGYLP